MLELDVAEQSVLFQRQNDTEESENGICAAASSRQVKDIAHGGTSNRNRKRRPVPRTMPAIWHFISNSSSIFELYILAETLRFRKMRCIMSRKNLTEILRISPIKLTDIPSD